jgi:hypothetical protein
MKPVIPILLLTFAYLKGMSQFAEPNTVADFAGTNTNVAAYDNKYLADLSKTVKWIREYHSWAHYEAANDYFKWDNITKTPHTYTWPDHNKFMDACRQLGIQVLIDALNKPQWAGSSPVPNTSGDGSQAADYMEKLDFMGQLVARYGSQKLPDSLLKTADKVSGLNYIRYFEDENEPDYWWKTPLWPPEYYAKYCNAVHDGYGVETSENFPLLGIKPVDPNAIHVLAGMALKDTSYLHRLLKASEGRVPFDILNAHMYCTDRTKGYSPENEIYGFEKGFESFFKWKNNNLPEMPVWITEFGWDTYKSPENKHSYIWAPFEQQANYLLRSYFILMKMGFEKAFMFMAADGNSQNVLQYSSSGLFTDKNSGHGKKISWYYLATLQNILGNYSLKDIPEYAGKTGENEIYCFRFESPESADQIFVAWTRKTGSDNDTGATVSYELDAGFIPGKVWSVFPKNLDEDGDTTEVTTEGSKLMLNLTETPQFVIVSALNSGIRSNKTGKPPALKIHRNPDIQKTIVSVSYTDREPVSLSVFSALGKLEKVLLKNEYLYGNWTSNLEGSFSPGIYFVVLDAGKKRYTEKVVIL